MPDHQPRALSEPPGRRDRVRLNVLSLSHTALAVLGGSLVAVDALVPDGRWLASYSLATIPVWVQVVIAVLLVAGGLVTAHGVLVRTHRGKKIAPLTTILTERIGWLLLTFGWGATAVAVFGNGRLGSTLSLVIMSGLALGALCKMLLLWQLERQVRAEILASARTEQNLRRLRGDQG
ncbi:hypothetical protein [Kocuria salsicia]|uniref:hypothetical protein n=1 Tax=Kocuria salsicia TaxID=664639 RepID=UPI00119FD02A|nr:hypothetical protein [Kocuria salsicia]